MFMFAIYFVASNVVFVCHSFEWCRTRRELLYVLPEIIRIGSKYKMLSRKSWGWDQEVEGYVFVAKIQFWRNYSWKKQDQCTSVLHLVDRPGVPYEVELWRNSAPLEIGFWLMCPDFLKGDFGCVLIDFTDVWTVWHRTEMGHVARILIKHSVEFMTNFNWKEMILQGLAELRKSV